MAHEKGEKLVCSQHGGWSYAFSRSIGPQIETEHPYHAFLTWGWRGQDDLPGRFFPLPSPLLADAIGKRRRGSSLILVGTHMGLQGFRMGGLPRFEDVLEYRKDKTRFFAALPAPMRADSQYRPYLRVLQDLEDEEFVAAAFPEVSILTGDLDQAMYGCRILVMDHPGSTLPPALVAGVPTICYWRPEARPLSSQSESIFAEWRRVGMLHDTPEAAARHAAAIWDDVDGWWQSPPVQAARREWCRHYALTRKLWWIDWLKGLYRLSSA